MKLGVNLEHLDYNTVMKTSCFQRLSKTKFICILTGVIVYESLVGEHHDHLAHQDFSPRSTYTITIASGTSNPSTSTTTTL